MARRYEREGMTRLSFDQEAWARGITSMPLPDDVHRDIERLLRGRLAELVRAGMGPLTVVGGAERSWPTCGYPTNP